MAEVREYRVRDFVRAEKVEKVSRVVTVNGVANTRPGDYLVYERGGVRVVNGETFERDYVPVESHESEAREFSPAGKTVDVVVEFLKENPDEIERVKQLERDGASRRGILEYEKR